MQATEELKAQLETQLSYCVEQAQVGERAVEHNRSQSIIMDELRHRVAIQDDLLRQKDRQVAELYMYIYIYILYVHICMYIYI